MNVILSLDSSQLPEDGVFEGVAIGARASDVGGDYDEVLDSKIKLWHCRLYIQAGQSYKCINFLISVVHKLRHGLKGRGQRFDDHSILALLRESLTTVKGVKNYATYLRTKFQRFSEHLQAIWNKIQTLALLIYVSQSNLHSDVTDWVPGPSYLIRLKKKNSVFYATR